MEDILLVELFPYHTECLYTQLLFLKKTDCRITMACDVRVEPIVRHFGLDDDVGLLFFDFKKIGSLIKLRNYIVGHNISKVIINTAQGSIPLKFLLLPFPRRTQFFGTIHNADKLATSYGQRLISRKVHSYFVLSKYQTLNFPKHKKLKVEYFNPSFFPHYPHPDNLPDKDNHIWVVVPGGLEYKRRDYGFLLRFVREYRPAGVKFVLLGNSTKGNGPQIVAEIKKQGLDNHFILFGEFVPNGLFHYYLKNSDYLLPLIHPSVPQADHYTKCQISGTFPLSLAYDKPLLCHTMFACVQGFEYPTLWYADAPALASLLNNGKNTEHRLKLIFEEETKRYIKHLNESLRQSINPHLQNKTGHP